MRYREENGIISACEYQIVWCTKYRKQVLLGNIKEDLCSIILQMCFANDVRLIELNVENDFVYMKVSMDTKTSVHKIVKCIKAESSGYLREKYAVLRSRVPTLWTNAYFATTDQHYPVIPIKRFLEMQYKV